MIVDPEFVADASFAPNAGGNHFHAFFSQWMLDLGNRNQKCKFNVEWTSVPKGWRTYISMTDDPTSFEITTTQAELEREAIGAMQGQVHQLEIRGRPVTV